MPIKKAAETPAETPKPRRGRPQSIHDRSTHSVWIRSDIWDAMYEHARQQDTTVGELIEGKFKGLLPKL